MFGVWLRTLMILQDLVVEAQVVMQALLPQDVFQYPSGLTLVAVLEFHAILQVSWASGQHLGELVCLVTEQLILIISHLFHKLSLAVDQWAIQLRISKLVLKFFFTMNFTDLILTFLLVLSKKIYIRKLLQVGWKLDILSLLILCQHLQQWKELSKSESKLSNLKVMNLSR